VAAAPEAIVMSIARAILAAVILSAGASATRAEIDVKLSVDPDTHLQATLLSMDESSQSVQPSGSVTLRLVLIEHPTHGTLAESVELLPGSLTFADLDWSLSGSLESLSAGLIDGEASLVISPVTTIPVAPHAAAVAPDAISVELASGQLSATGVVVEHPIFLMHDLASAPFPVDLGAGATVVTTPNPSGTFDVVLRVPIDEAVPLDPPFLVSWLQIGGELVLSGTTALTVPASSGPLWLASALLLASALAFRLGGSRRGSASGGTRDQGR
jgi:hypothetical protein